MINLILGQVDLSSIFLIEDVDSFSLLAVETSLILVPGFIGA